MRKTIFLFLIFCFLSGNAQSIEERLDKVNSIKDAEEFIVDNPDLFSLIFEAYPEIEDDLPAFYKKLKIGEVFSWNGEVYKVLSIGRETAFKVNYIYLDGSKLSMQEINELRSLIIDQYKKGVPFANLAKEFTMDGNTTGDLKWFTKGMMVPEFENAARNHKKGAIYTVDVPGTKWYYVTLKTHYDKNIAQITLLKVHSFVND